MAAAGIGEASAILSVAQIGISLSKSLITYIEEVKGAPSHINRIANEILTTSERLKDIGELVNQNPHTKVFSKEGVNSAVRCSTECQQIVEEVKNVLCKGGWQDRPKDSDKDGVDTSLFSTLRWPFAKIRLEVPRAELHRIKLDLSLLFSAAMVLGASTTLEKQRLAQDIPPLHKSRAWAAKRIEKAKEMAQYRSRNSRSRDVPWSDDEPEMLEEFITFKESVVREEEEKRIRERAKIIQAEEDARRRKEEDAQREVERKAVEEYKKHKQEQETRSAEKRENFKRELERLGLESSQIQLVLENSKLDFQGESGTALVPEVRPSSFPREIEQDITPSATSGWSRLSLPWWRPKKSLRESSPESSLSSMLTDSGTGPHPHLEFETWLLDFSSNRSTELLPSVDWLIAKMKTIKKDQDVWSHFARLRPHWRNRIFAFLEIRRDEDPGWTLYHLEIPQKWSRTRIFGQRRDEQLIQLILSRRRMIDQDSDLPRERSKAEGPGGGLPKRVSFAGGLEEEIGTEKGVDAARDHAPPTKPLEISQQIARLEEKRNGLGVHDYERMADLDEMIDYLRDQLRSENTHASALNTTTFNNERQWTPMRSESSQAPVIIYEERIPSSGRHNDIIVEEHSYGRGSSPPPPPRRTVYEEKISVAGRHPRATHDDFEIVEEREKMDTSPGKTNYQSRYGVRNNNRYGARERRRSSREEEDMTVIYHDHDRSSQRGWQERSRSRSRPSRQDSVGTRGGPIIIRRDRSWERSKSRPSRPSRQLSKETDYYDTYIRPRRRRTEGEEDRWSPEVREIVVRGDTTSRPRTHDRRHILHSESDSSANGSRVRRGRPIADTSGESRALILRAGASGLPYNYVRERVLNGGIRVRGDNDVASPISEAAISQHIRRHSRPPTSRRNSYRDRSLARSLGRRLSETLHQYDSSEEEESGYPFTKGIDSENGGPETEPSDAEVIAQTLKQYTTIQDSDIPATGASAPSTRTKSEVGPSALKNASYASPGSELKRSLPVPGRKAHFEQDNGLPQPAKEGQSRAMSEGSKPMDEGPFMNIISEEPDVMTEEIDIPHHQRVVYFPERPIPPRPQQKPSLQLPTDLAHNSREASPRSQSRDSRLNSPRERPANGPIIIEHGGYTLASQSEIPNHAAQEEIYDEVDMIRTVSRNPTVYEEVD